MRHPHFGGCARLMELLLLLGGALEGFTAQQASRLTQCTAHQLRYWDKVDLVTPTIQGTGGRPGRRRLYSFRDLVALRVVKSLLDNGMSVQRVRRAWDYLRRTAGMDEHLAEDARLREMGWTDYGERLKKRAEKKRRKTSDEDES